MVLVLAVALQAAPLAEVPSIEGWTLSHEAARCTIQRDLIMDSGWVTVALQAIPLGNDYRLLAFYPSMPGAQARIERITVRNSASSQTKNDLSMPITDSPGRLVRADLPRDLFKMPDGDSLTLEPDRERAFSLSAKDVESGLAMLSDCEARVASEWEIDPTQVAQVAVPAEPIDRSARLSGGTELSTKPEAGTVITLLTLKKNGRVDNCKVVQTSGKKALDSVTCRIFREKVRYRPARNSSGEPIRSWTTALTEWAASP